MTAVRRLVRHYLARQPYQGRHALPEQAVPNARLIYKHPHGDTR